MNIKNLNWLFKIMSNGQVKIKDIAKLAQVSAGTVDRVIHNRPRVSKASREKVERVLKELNYKPNIFARNLVLKENTVFAVLIPMIHAGSYEDPHFKLLRKGIDVAAKELKNMKTEIRIFYFEKMSDESLKKALKQVEDEKVSGLVFASAFSSEHAHDIISQFAEKMPIVTFYPCDCDKLSAQITVKADASAFLAAKLMKGYCTNGTIATFELEDYLLGNKRLTGLEKYFRESNIPVDIVSNVLDWDNHTTGFKSDFDNVFAKYKDVKVMYFSGPLVYHAARYMDKYWPASQPRPLLIGYDLTDENVECLENGSIDYIISTRTREQGYQAIKVLYKTVVLKTIEEKLNLIMPLEVVTQYNLENIIGYQFNL